MSSGTDNDAAIRTHGLTKRFGDLVAVDDLDLVIRRGRIYGFLGPNGSGKTTTIRMLAGLLLPSDGDIRVLGMDVPEKAERLKHRIGYMTQRFSLYQDLSVIENLRFIAAIYSVPAGRVAGRINELLDRYRLADRVDQRAGTLSGGQRQRLALAAATLHEPELLFLDEPTSAVDPQSRRDFWESLFELADSGTTILVSTHYMDEAERCHELAILDRGALAAAGPPAELMADIDASVVQVETDTPRRASALLEDLGDVIGVTQIGNLLRVQVTSSRENAADYIGNRLSDAGYRAQCERVDASLEDVFVAVTRPAEENA